MTYGELVNKFLEMVEKIKSLKPAYKQPGDGSNGVCDCIGLIIGAVRRMGLEWKGIHGSNYGARYQTTGLQYIASLSQLNLGDVVYKGCNENGIVKKACNQGTIKRTWKLPDRYKKGRQYCNNDMNDYYHAGVVTSINPLRVTHMTTPSMKVDKDLSGGWNYHGRVKPVLDASSGVTPTPTPAPSPAPVDPATSGSKAIVVADNGYPVKMRQYPSDSCATWDKLPVGTEVTIIDPGEEWAKINGGKRKGWYMKAKFLDIVGDGKGKY